MKTIMDNISIKNNIRKIRKARKMTQEAMAHSLGISVTAYRDFEKGKTSVLNETITKMAALLDISAEELLLGYEPTQAKEGKMEALKLEYSKRIDELEMRVREQERLIKTLEETVESKNEIIAMLKKMLGKDK